MATDELKVEVAEPSRIGLTKDISDLFSRLERDWRKDTEHVSLMDKRAMHPSYQRIIGLGEPAVPIILQRLLEEPTVAWFWALRAITGENPVHESSSDDAAIDAWLTWGKQRGYLGCRLK